jgi:hypothetical protein
LLKAPPLDLEGIWSWFFFSLSCNYSAHFVFDCAVNRTMRSGMDIIALARGTVDYLTA